MNRQDIQLLAAARTGDPDARCRVGLNYLRGDGSFPRHVRSGIDHLMHPSVRHRASALQALCATLTLEELLQEGLLPTLQHAASTGLDCAIEKLALWWLTTIDQRRGGLQMLRSLALQGRSDLQVVLRADGDEAQRACRVFWALARPGRMHGPTVLHQAWGQALAETSAGAADAPARLACLRWHLQLMSAAAARDQEGFIAEVVATLDLLEACGDDSPGLPVETSQRLLAQAGEQADVRACYRLGRALSGLPCGAMAADTLTPERNLRKGTALLLRAADGGCVDAWMHLYRLSAEHRSSVANPQMARFFLEKAAEGGLAEAQRRLGVLLLRGSRTLSDSEAALGWLHKAHLQGDALAAQVMASLVLPVAGADADAHTALLALQHVDPLLAARLELARCFGLTRSEALSMDPARGERPWGLVVGPIDSLRQPRLAAPRAVPAVNPQAQACLHTNSALFQREPGESAGTWRGRTRSLRVLLAQHDIPESLFFAPATGAVLDALRRGSRWAVRARPLLREALGHEPMAA